jgi:hypothetical protein
MAAARHLLAAVLLWAAFSSAAPFTDPSDGTFAHPRPAAIDLLLLDSSAPCVHYDLRAHFLSVDFVNARVVLVAFSLSSAHTLGWFASR